MYLTCAFEKLMFIVQQIEQRLASVPALISRLPTAINIEASPEVSGYGKFFQLYPTSLIAKPDAKPVEAVT